MKTGIMILLGLVWGHAVTAASDETIERLENELAQTRAELQALRDTVESLQPGVARVPAPALSAMVAGGMGEPRPMLGVVLGNSPDGEGVRLAAVTPDAPAARAGLQAGDLVVAIDNHRLEGRRAVSQAYDLLGEIAEGKTYEFEIARKGEHQKIPVTAEMVKPSLAFSFSGSDFDGPGQNFSFGWNQDNQALDLERFRSWAQDSRDWSVIVNSGRPFPALDLAPRVWAAGLNWAKLELAALNPQLGRYFGSERGVLVIDTRLDDPALQAGDVILEVDGKSVSEPSDTLRALQDFQPGQMVPLRVLRDGQNLALEIETPDSPGNGYFYQFRSRPEDN